MALVLLGGPFSAVAGAKPVPIASGPLTCHLFGKLTFSPPLVDGGAEPETVSVKVAAKLCQGPSGVTSGMGKLTFDLPNNDCAPLFSKNDDSRGFNIAGSFKWRGVTRIADTMISESPPGPSPPSTAGVYLSDWQRVFVLMNPPSVTGSFGDAPYFQVVGVLANSPATNQAACAPGANGHAGGGLKKMKFSWAADAQVAVFPS